MVTGAASHAVEEGFAKPRYRMAVAAGIPFAVAGNTNNIRVVQI